MGHGCPRQAPSRRRGQEAESARLVGARHQRARAGDAGAQRRRAQGDDAPVPGASGQRRRPRRPADRSVRRGPRGCPTGHRPAPLRRPAHGRRGTPLRVGRRDEDRRGQDPRLHPAGVPQRPRRPGHAPRHDERLPGSSRLRVDGADPPLARPQRRAHHPGRLRPGVQARAVRVRPDLRHEQRVRVRLPPRQHGDLGGGQGPAWARLRDRRRGRLDPDRRGPHSAHHQRPGRGRREALLPLREHRARPSDRARLRRRRREAHRRARPKRASSESSRRSGSTTSTTR